VPKITKATTMGPMVVPKELIPPVKFKRCEPVSGLPSAIAKGKLINVKVGFTKWNKYAV